MTRVDQPNIPKGTLRDPRKTEDTDTRQALQRHDPEFYRKKKDKDGEGGFKDPYEDLTDVSVPALRNFLLGLIEKTAPAAGADPAAIAPADDHNRKPAANPQTAAAINAYQSGFARGGGVGQPPPPPLAATEPPPTALDQAAKNLDRGMLIELIRDLDRLAGEGISTLKLEKGDGFLESIREAIQSARTGP